MKRDYELCYQRNLGLLTAAQQAKLRAAKVVVAGVGGVGGVEAATLARMGVGRMTIFDPGVFDEPDMNRQFGAVASNIGRKKAPATAELLAEINPFMEIETLDYAPATGAELDRLLEGASVVIDAIDYMGFDYKALFAQAARRAGLFNFTAPISGVGTAMIVFSPDGMTLEEFYDAPSDERQWRTHILRLDKLLGPGRFGGLVADMLEGRRAWLSNCAGIATLNGGLVATEIALYLTGLRPASELIIAPKAVYINLLNRVFEIYDMNEESLR